MMIWSLSNYPAIHVIVNLKLELMEDVLMEINAEQNVLYTKIHVKLAILIILVL